MKNKLKGRGGYVAAGLIIIAAFLPLWTLCSDACGNRGAINIGFIFLGLEIAAMTALSSSKVPAESKKGCSIMLLAIFLPLTFLGFAIMVNFWYLLMLGGPAIIFGLVLLIVGIVSYTKSLEGKK
jgi:hypothetical protein